MTVPFRTFHRCPVCGFGEVLTDQVVHDGLIELATCPRCDHRWTARFPAAVARAPLAGLLRAPVARVPAPARRERGVVAA